MGIIQLKRRSILRGLGGVTLALPFLDAMTGVSRASAAPIPKRFVVIYGGISSAADRAPSPFVPDKEGLNYDLKRALLPLGTGALPKDPGIGGTGYDVQDHVSVLSGLKIPWDTGSGIPAGGKSPEFHFNTLAPQLSGMRGGPGRKEPPNGPTADQIVAKKIAEGTTSLSCRVQAASYVGLNSTGGNDGRISWSKGADGKINAIDPVFSPSLLYSKLFTNFVPTEPEEKKAAELRIRRHRSAVDLVSSQTKALLGRLGQEDSVRMEQHYDGVRSLEERLQQVPPIGGSCSAPEDPGSDPPLQGAAIEYKGNGGDGTGYSNEDLRAELLFDMIHHSFACDLSRVAAVRMSYSQSSMQCAQLFGREGQFHGFGHHPNPDGVADGLSWHVKHMARLIALLRDSQEADGSSLLDHTAVVFLLEGGNGYDPEGGNEDVGHSTENMVALVGGHAGGLNKSGGKHIATNKAHPAQAVLSAMMACGVNEDTEQLGEVKGRIDELFT